MVPKNSDNNADEDNPFDLPDVETPVETAPKTDSTPVEAKTTEPKAKRRTKAELEEEAITDAQKLLKSKGFVVSEVTSVEDGGDRFVPTHLPVNASVGDIVGALQINSAGVAVLTLSVRRWVGEPPMVIQAAQLDDLAAVLAQLRADSLTAKEA